MSSESLWIKGWSATSASLRQWPGFGGHKGACFGHESPQKLASRREEDKNIVVAVNGFRRWSSKASGNVASSSACRPDGRGEEEDDHLHRLGPTHRSDTESVSRPVRSWAGLWADSVGFGQVSHSPIFSISFSFLFLLFSVLEF
jgi:hypothetical protein